jgi:hypothetical protein
MLQFDRDAMATWYARQHLETDPGLRRVYYLPKDARAREIRLVEVNELLADMNDDALEAIDFGVDTGAEFEHKLVVLDVTPAQWDSISHGKLSLPRGWSLENAVDVGNPQR